MRVGYRRFKDRFNSKKYKEFQKKIKKKEYLEYQYESLSDYFTKRTDFYYNLDLGLAALVSDLLTNYKLIASEIIDITEYDMDKKLEFIIKFFKKYTNIDKLDLANNLKRKQKYDQDKKKAFKYFRDIFSQLWY